MKIAFISQPLEAGRRLGDLVENYLSSREWNQLVAAVAFAKKSGVKHLLPSLTTFVQKAKCQLYLGIDHGGTSHDALKALATVKSPNFNISIVHNTGPYTFHPKVFIFKAQSKAKILLGSGNLTEGGLFTNYEAGVDIELDLNKDEDAENLKALEGMIRDWATHPSGNRIDLSSDLLQKLKKSGDTPVEKALKLSTATVAVESSETAIVPGQKLDVFGSAPIAKAPSVSVAQTKTTTSKKAPHISPKLPAAPATFFLMTLQKTDVGKGQTTKGTARRSPELFVPLAARDYMPEFWGWPTQFNDDPKKEGKRDRRGVKVLIGGKIVDVNMMTWPDKSDFRLRSESLRSAGQIEDILKVQKAPKTASFDYIMEIIPKQSAEYANYLAMCSNKTRGNSKRVWGYYSLS